MAKIIKNRKQRGRVRRHARVRTRVTGTAERPRLSVFKSNRFMYAQLIDDANGRTLASASTKELKGKTMLEKAKELGKAIAEAGNKAKISTVTFDRGGYLYTGRIKAIADGARESGLKF